MNKLPYGTHGRMIFDRLWKALKIRGKNKQYLKANGIHSNTVAKLTKNENVSCEVLAHICCLLDCQPWDIMEYVKKRKHRLIRCFNSVLFCKIFGVWNLIPSILFSK